MAIDYTAIRDALVSAAQLAGVFDAVEGHEPKNAPGRGLTCFVFYAGKRTVQRGGLKSTTVRLNWTVQARCSMTREPQDAIDIDLLGAVDAVYRELHTNFTLDISGVRAVDLLGAEGDPLLDVAGYIDQDGHKFRVIEIFVGIVVNDAWEQVA